MAVPGHTGDVRAIKEKRILKDGRQGEMRESFGIRTIGKEENEPVQTGALAAAQVIGQSRGLGK